jgi:hypothetical protein
MAKTVQQLSEWGFVPSTTKDERRLQDYVVFERTRYSLVRGAKEQLALEVLAYPNGSTSYWIELIDWHGLLCTPYRLDSWKHRDDRVEFKFHVDAKTGMSLSFMLFRDALDPLSEASSQPFPS